MLNFEVVNYADDQTPFSAKLDGRSVIDELEISSSILFIWIKDNYMKTYTEKRHVPLTGINNLTANTDGKVIESKDIKLLSFTWYNY